jgi:hypothetical protein
MDRRHPALRPRLKHVPIICDIVGEIVWVRYGDRRTGIWERGLTVTELVEAAANVYVRGLMHDNGEVEDIRFDLIHQVSELPSGVVHNSAVAWLARYGVVIGLHRDGGRVRCRVLESPGRRESKDRPGKE